METIFDFSGVEQKFTHTIDTDIILNLRQTFNSLNANLYFTNSGGSVIPIPEGIVVRSYTFEFDQNLFVERPYGDNYILSWINYYIIELNSTILMELKPKRTWNVIIP